MLDTLLARRHLPPLTRFSDGSAVISPKDWRLRREEMLDILSREEYGYTPPPPKHVTGTIVSRAEMFGGKAIQSEIRISFDTPGGEFSFPLTLMKPASVRRAPFFVHIAFRSPIVDRYTPAEEIIDAGYAVALFNYLDIVSDDESFDKLATLYPRDPNTGWGTIGMWAFAASRVLDYLLTRDDLDPGRSAVAGHSRLGKTALWCAAQDERFLLGISNCSGCSGAALSRGKIGETVRAISDHFPHWFCGNYRGWSGREEEMPFDQHMLLALIAPRYAAVGTGIEDTGSDPWSQFLCCAAADPAWRLLGMNGLVSPDEMADAGTFLPDGHIEFHMRPWNHFFTRTDWQYYIAFRDRHGI